MFQVILVLALFAHAINGQSEICNTTRYSFFNDFPECLLAFEGAALNASVGYEVDDETVYLICANETCQTAITDYVHSCRSEEVMFQQSATTFGCIQVSDDAICFDAVADFEGGFTSLISNLSNLTQMCGSDYLTGICSDCIEELSMLSDQLGCCYSEAVRIITSTIPDQFKAETSLGIYTRDYFSFCNIEAPMFCQDGVTPPPSACAAAVEALFGGDDETCANFARQLASGANIPSEMMPTLDCLIRVVTFTSSCDIDVTLATPCEMAIAELFGPGDNCARYAAVLPRNNTHRISFEQADNAMDVVCGTPGCSDRVNNFVVQCLPAGDAAQFQAYVLQFGCRINANGESCFAVQQSGRLNEVAAAFMPGGTCFEVFLDSCRPPCSSIVTEAVRSSQCCTYEFAQTALGMAGSTASGITVNGVLNLCGVSSPGRCAEQTEGAFRSNGTFVNIDTNPGGGNDGASAMVGYTMLIILLTLLPLLTS